MAALSVLILAGLGMVGAAELAHLIGAGAGGRWCRSVEEAEKAAES